MTIPFDVLNHDDLRSYARRRLPRFLFEYLERGTEDEIAVAGNRAAFERVKLRHRIMVDVGSRNLATTVFGRQWSMPIAIAPTGSAAMLWHNGERALARAAAVAGIPFTMSGGASIPVEDAVAEGGELWFQLYIWRDAAMVDAIVDRVERAGASALVVTGDTAAFPIREYNARNGFSSPFKMNRRAALDMILRPGWSWRVLLPYLVGSGIPRYENLPAGMRVAVNRSAPEMTVSPAFDWAGFDRLRRRWPRTLIVKGIMTEEDALLARDHGADGIIISNHGGRNLDSAPATLSVLPRIAEIMGGRLPILLDGGVRRGSDAVKAIALGASAVMAGRLPLYGCALAGEPGVTHALDMFRKGLDATMGFIGRCDIGAIDRTVIDPARP